MKEIIQQTFPYFREIRQKIHAYPELCYEEKLTAELVAKELSKMGLTAQMGVGKTGVVAILDSGIPGKTVGLRADMDALPLQEATQLSYRSTYANKMHALGKNKVFIKPLPARASEDFSFFLQKIPGCYFFIGNGINEVSCHNANYDFNDQILPIATEMLCQIAMDYLRLHHHFTIKLPYGS